MVVAGVVVAVGRDLRRVRRERDRLAMPPELAVESEDETEDVARDRVRDGLVKESPSSSSLSDDKYV